MKRKFWFCILLLFVIVPVVIQVLFCLQTPYRLLQANWSAGEILTYIGTVFLGAIAAWQNERLKKANDEAQSRLEKLTLEANQLSYISKVIEYELLKREKMENCIEAFQEAVSSQNLVGCLIGKNRIEVEKVLDSEKKLDESYLHLCAVIGEKKQFELSEYYENVVEMNKKFKNGIEIIKKHMKDGVLPPKDINDLGKYIKEINDRRLDMEKQKAEFLMCYQKDLDKLIYGKYENRDDIQSIY